MTLYFDICIATYRLLHRPSVDAWLAVVLENFRLKQPLFTNLGRAKAATVLTVLAVATFHEGKVKGHSDSSPLNNDEVGHL